MQLNTLNNLAESLNNTAQMPVLFLGHGSPMNAIEENEFVKRMAGSRENHSHAQYHFMHFRTLGDPGHFRDCHGET